MTSLLNDRAMIVLCSLHKAEPFQPLHSPMSQGVLLVSAILTGGLVSGIFFALNRLSQQYDQREKKSHEIDGMDQILTPVAEDKQNNPM
jgi:hypothetical protein